MNIAELILAGGHADAPAVHCGRHVLTYGALGAAARGWGARLLDQGLPAGSRVGLFAENLLVQRRP